MYKPKTKYEIEARKTWEEFNIPTLAEKKNCYTCKFEPYWKGESLGLDRRCKNPKMGNWQNVDICKDSDPTALFRWETRYVNDGMRDCAGDVELHLTGGRFEILNCECWELKQELIIK